MKLKLILLLITVIIETGVLYSENNDKSENFPTSYLIKYQKNDDTICRMKFSFSEQISERYIREGYPLEISWILKDKYNNNEKNYSLYSLIDLGLSYFVKTNKKNIYSPYFLINSSHYFLLNKLKEKHFTINFALLAKNNTDIFVMKKNKWAQISPGVGLRVFIGRMYGLTAEIGIENRSIYLFNSNKYINNSSGFFSFGILLYPF